MPLRLCLHVREESAYIIFVNRRWRRIRQCLGRRWRHSHHSGCHANHPLYRPIRHAVCDAKRHPASGANGAFYYSSGPGADVVECRPRLRQVLGR